MTGGIEQQNTIESQETDIQKQAKIDAQGVESSYLINSTLAFLWLNDEYEDVKKTWTAENLENDLNFDVAKDRDKKMTDADLA